MANKESQRQKSARLAKEAKELADKKAVNSLTTNSDKRLVDSGKVNIPDLDQEVSEAVESVVVRISEVADYYNGEDDKIEDTLDAALNAANQELIDYESMRRNQLMDKVDILNRAMRRLSEATGCARHEIQLKDVEQLGE